MHLSIAIGLAVTGVTFGQDGNVPEGGDCAVALPGAPVPPREDEHGNAICEPVVDEDAWRKTFLNFGGMTMPGAIVGLRGGRSENCPAGDCNPNDPKWGEYRTDINVTACTLNFEEPCGDLYYTDYGTGGVSVAHLFFRRIDHCDHFHHGDASHTGQGGPSPTNTDECFFFRACHPVYYPGQGQGNEHNHYSNEVALSLQTDGSAWWTYVSCYTGNPNLSGPGLITSVGDLYRDGVCPGEDLYSCKEKCPTTENVAYEACIEGCATLC